MSFVDPQFELESRLAPPLFAARLARGVARLGVALRDRLEAERTQLPLWLSAGLGLGIALYFALRDEPRPWQGLCLLALSLSLAALARRRSILAQSLAAMLVAASLGFCAAQARTALVGASMLQRPAGPLTVQGRVETRTVEADGTARVTLKVETFGANGAAGDWPRRVRFTLKQGVEDAAAGARIKLLVKLMPPNGPAAPGAYDFARRAFFEGIGGVGYAMGRPVVLERAAGRSISAAVSLLRDAIAARVAAAMPGAAGGIAVALMTGLRGAVPPEADEALRASGLTHLLSISGIHISLVALALFGAARLALILSEQMALRLPTKKIAAACAVLGTGAYVYITGANVPAERSFIMTGLVLLAVIWDRRAITLRNVVLAGSAVLLLVPESLLDVSFQMSFAATLALVAAFERWQTRRRGAGGPLGSKLFWGAVDHVAALALTSLVAGLATAPFSAYHFQTISAYGLIANMVAVPLTGIFVMPSILVAYVLMPLGLDAPALLVMRLGLDGVLAVARLVAALPGAVFHLPAGPLAALTAITLGGLWVCFWRTGWRRFGFGLAALGVALWAVGRGPDIVIARDMKSIAARDAEGRLAVIQGKPDAYQPAVWLRRAGYGDEPARAAAGLRCDALGCIMRLQDGSVLALSHSPGSLAEDCAKARILISDGRIRRRCIGPELVIDRITALREGSLAIWVEPGGLRVKGAGGERDGRPWSPRYVPRARLNTAE